MAFRHVLSPSLVFVEDVQSQGGIRHHRERGYHNRIVRPNKCLFGLTSCYGISVLYISTAPLPALVYPCSIQSDRPATNPARTVRPDDPVFSHKWGRQPLVRILDSFVARCDCRCISHPLFPRYIRAIGERFSRSVGWLLGIKVILSQLLLWQ
jgi:hypothetical protein